MAKHRQTSDLGRPSTSAHVRSLIAAGEDEDYMYEDEDAPIASYRPPRAPEGVVGPDGLVCRAHQIVRT